MEAVALDKGAPAGGDNGRRRGRGRHEGAAGRGLVGEKWGWGGRTVTLTEIPWKFICGQDMTTMGQLISLTMRLQMRLTRGGTADRSRPLHEGAAEAAHAQLDSGERGTDSCCKLTPV